jgi:hypothetical protein
MNAQSDPGHGHSPAAWTAVTIILIAFAAGTLAFWLDLPVFVWVSAALIVVGLLVGAVMARAGYGARGPRYSPKAHS